VLSTITHWGVPCALEMRDLFSQFYFGDLVSWVMAESSEAVLHEQLAESPMSKVREAFELPSAECEASPQTGSTHSRLRKDLVNLNKAVIKWLGHEEIGVLTRAKLMERIRTSTAARQLCEAHGDRFRREEFECLALNRAIAARLKNSLAQS